MTPTNVCTHEVGLQYLVSGFVRVFSVATVGVILFALDFASLESRDLSLRTRLGRHLPGVYVSVPRRLIRGAS